MFNTSSAILDHQKTELCCKLALMIIIKVCIKRKILFVWTILRAKTLTLEVVI